MLTFKAIQNNENIQNSTQNIIELGPYEQYKKNLYNIMKRAIEYDLENSETSIESIDNYEKALFLEKQPIFLKNPSITSEQKVEINDGKNPSLKHEILKKVLEDIRKNSTISLNSKDNKNTKN